MLIKYAQNLQKCLLVMACFFLIFSIISSANISKAVFLNNINMTGTGITSNSSALSTAITPTISIAFASSLNPGDTLTIIFRGVTTSSDLFETEVTFGGDCSGTTDFATNPIPSGTANPIFSITGITCGNGNSNISFSAGNLVTTGVAGTYPIEIITPSDYGVLYFFVGGNNQVVITASVNGDITIKVYPEKRIPATGNWVNQNIIEIRPVGSTTPLVSQVVNMDANGDGTMVNVDGNLVPAGTYDFAIKGYSHLRRIYTASVGAASTNLNFTGAGLELLAGDTSVVEDNYVNSLDLSQISIFLYTNNIKNDLNRDGEVNSLDLSNMSYNLYLAGQE